MKKAQVCGMNINDFTPWREGEYPQFSSAEKRCSHIANNPHHKHIRQFKVDGEVFPPGTPQKRCDYLLLDDTGHQSYYIELKGSDVLAAIAQIEDTISEISPSIKDYMILCRIVYRTATHELNGSKVLRWKQQRKNVIIKSVRIEETI